MALTAMTLSIMAFERVDYQQTKSRKWIDLLVDVAVHLIIAFRLRDTMICTLCMIPLSYLIELI